MVRAGWNYFVVEGDPKHELTSSFVNAVLNATVRKDLRTERIRRVDAGPPRRGPGLLLARRSQ
jgi:hypothetical protein